MGDFKGEGQALPLEIDLRIYADLRRCLSPFRRISADFGRFRG